MMKRRENTQIVFYSNKATTDVLLESRVTGGIILNFWLCLGWPPILDFEKLVKPEFKAFFKNKVEQNFRRDILQKSCTVLLKSAQMDSLATPLSYKN
jgi:hypothetical protein